MKRDRDPGAYGRASRRRFVLALSAFGSGCALAGAAGAYAVDQRLGWNPAFALLPVAAAVAVFVWRARERDVVEVFAGAWVVAYAGYLGLAATRVPTLPSVGMQGWRFIGPWTLGLAEQWPVVLLGGVAFALIVAVAVALPVAAIPFGRSRRAAGEDEGASEALWRFVREHNARAALPPRRLTR